MICQSFTWEMLELYNYDIGQNYLVGSKLDITKKKKKNLTQSQWGGSVVGGKF